MLEVEVEGAVSGVSNNGNTYDEVPPSRVPESPPPVPPDPALASEPVDPPVPPTPPVELPPLPPLPVAPPLPVEELPPLPVEEPPLPVEDPPLPPPPVSDSRSSPEPHAAAKPSATSKPVKRRVREGREKRRDTSVGIVGKRLLF
jgi:hypothetical protein